MKPYVVCHMAASLDGRTRPSRWRPQSAHDNVAYDAQHAELGGGSWLVGRTTGQEFAKRDSPYPAAQQTLPRTPWLPQRAQAYSIVLDTHGKIAWGCADVGSDPLVVVLSEAVSDDHLAGLRTDGVGYLFAGAHKIELETTLGQLYNELGIERLLLEGGGTINGAFLRAGLIDEISLLLEPAIDGRGGAPALFDGDEHAPAPPLQGLELSHCRQMNGGSLRLRYTVRRDDHGG